MSENKVFRLDDMPQLWGQFRDKDALGKECIKWCDEFKDTLKSLAKGKTQFYLGGRLVANLTAGQLNKSRLAKEQPQIIEMFTREVTRREFDQAAFKKQMPEMFAAYQAQSLVLAKEPIK